MTDETTSSSRSEQPSINPAKRRRFIVIAAVIVVLVGAGVLIWWLIARNYETTDDAYVDARLVYLSPQIAGRALHVYANDNQSVHQGELLVAIDPADLQARLGQTQAQVAQAEAQVAQSEAQIKVTEANYQQMRATAVSAAAQAANAARDLERYEGLQRTQPNAVAAQQVDQADAQAVSTAAQHDAAAKQVAAAFEQVNAARTQIAAAQAQLKAAQAESEQAQLNLSYTQIVAPCDGTIANQSVAAGSYLQPGQQLLAIVPNSIWITANFKETQLALMRPGQAVDIRIDAYSSTTFTGHVDSIQRGAGQAFSVLPAQNATGNFIKVVQRVPVKILIDGLEDRRYVLGPGMSVRPRVHVR